MIIFALLYISYLNIYINDLQYYVKQSLFNKKDLNNNFSINEIKKINTDSVNNIKLLIISFDNRTTINYMTEHNKNIEEYCNKHKNIKYQFTNNTTKNVYWNKIYLVLEKLMTNEYDYILWMDTDAIFVNQDIDIRNIFLLFNSDIYLSHDNDYLGCENILNAGVFIVKNSIIGINFLKEAIDYVENSKCINEDNSLKGLYSLKCYEQGTINDLIYNKYYKYTTILTTNIIFNTNYCNENTFILHNYGGIANKYDVKGCFNKINSKLNI
jgi:hypothetical protein